MLKPVKWATLNPNQRDALIAQYIFKRTILDWREDRDLLMERENQARCYESIPHYTTSMDTAWTILKYFASLPEEPFESRWKKQLFMHGLDVLPCNDPSWYDISYETLASWTSEKIAIAALEAVGIEVHKSEQSPN